MLTWLQVHVGSWLQAVSAVAGWLVCVLIGVGLVCAATAFWWRSRARRELQRRVGVDLVPSETFDPPPESVGWFAGQLGRVPAAAGALPQRARAVRVEMSCIGGQLAYRLEGPQEAASVLRLSAYPEVEVLEARSVKSPPRIHFAGVPPVSTERKEHA